MVELILLVVLIVVPYILWLNVQLAYIDDMSGCRRGIAASHLDENLFHNPDTHEHEENKLVSSYLILGDSSYWLPAISAHCRFAASWPRHLVIVSWSKRDSDILLGTLFRTKLTSLGQFSKGDEENLIKCFSRLLFSTPEIPTLH